MQMKYFPTIDLEATGRQIVRLRKERGLSVRDLQSYFGFEAPQAIYKWQKGLTLPSVDNLYALSALLEVPMDAILVQVNRPMHVELQDNSCSSVFFVFGVVFFSCLYKPGHPVQLNCSLFSMI